MKKFKLCVMPLVAVSLTSPSVAAESLYVAIGGGISFPATRSQTIPLSNGKNFTVSRQNSSFLKTEIGMNYAQFRTGFELMFLPQNYKDLKDGSYDKVKNHAAFINAYYDIKEISEIITPFFSLGIGIRNANGKSSSGTTNPNIKNALAWQTGIGSRIKVSNSIDIEVAYKYIDLGRIRFENIPIDLKLKNNIHTLSAALMLKFY